MFKTKNHSTDYLDSLFKLLPRKGLRYSTYSHFLGYLLIVLIPNLHLYEQKFLQVKIKLRVWKIIKL